MIYQFGNFSLDTRSFLLNRDGKNQPVEPQVFDLLLYLIEHRDRVVTRDELLDNLWKGRVVSENTLNGRLKAARKAIGDDGRKQEIIRTLHRRGYQFVAVVSVCADSDLEMSIPTPLPEALSDKPSVAVLPFDNQSDSNEADYFADGLTQEINANLCRYRDLLVIDSSSAFQLGKSGLSNQDFALGLGVQYFTNGSVRKAGNRIRVSVRLIETGSGKLIWADSQDKAYDDIFVIEDEIAEKIATNIANQIEGEGIAIAARKTPGSLSAYDYVLRSRKFSGCHATEDIAEERALLRKAIELDPLYPAAYAGLACSFVREFESGWCKSRKAALDQAVEYGRKAESLDSNYSYAHMALGWAYLHQKKFELAETHLNRAIDCNPSDHDSYCIKTWLLAGTGRSDEVAACSTRAMQLNPLVPDDCLAAIATAHYLDGNYESALEILEYTREPGEYSESLRAVCHARLGAIHKAREAAARTIELGGDIVRSPEWLDLWPIKDPEDRKHFLDDLYTSGVLGIETENC